LFENAIEAALLSLVVLFVLPALKCFASIDFEANE
jgi:hypothetical protein